MAREIDRISRNKTTDVQFKEEGERKGKERREKKIKLIKIEENI